MTPFPFEPELNQPLPRRVRLPDRFLFWLFRIVTLLPAVIGFAFLQSSVDETLRSIGYAVYGTKVEARIVAKFEEPGRKRAVRIVEYGYSVDGQDYTSREHASSDRYESSVVGDSITLEVLPWALSSGRRPIGAGLEVLALVISWGITLAWNGVLAAFFWHLYIFPWIERRLLRFGLVTVGIVRSIEPDTSRKGTWRRITYEYSLPAGDRPTRRLIGSMTGAVRAATAMNVGDSVTVLYDPRRPRRSLLYRLAESRIAAA